MKNIIAVILSLFLLCGCSMQNQSSESDRQHEKGEEYATADEFDCKSIKLNPVKSSAISEIGYSYEYSVLLVRFLESGQLYAYYDVPETVYRGLKSADSIGSYYNSFVKEKYEYKRLENE